MEESDLRFELLCKKQQQLDQKMERFCKEQPHSDQQWKLLLKEQQNLDELFRKERQNSIERLHNSIYSLAQLILEKQGVSNPSLAASQLFDVMSENKEEEILQTTFHLFDEMPQKEIGSLDKHYPQFVQGITKDVWKQTTFLEAKQCHSEALKLAIEQVKLEPQSDMRYYTPNNLKPSPTFRSLISTTQCNPFVSASIDTDLHGQNPLKAKPYYPSYVSNAAGNYSSLSIPHNSGYNLIPASQVPRTNNFMHEDYSQSLGQDHSFHWFGLLEGLKDWQQVQPSQLDGPFYPKENYFNQGLYASEGMATFEESSHSIDADVMGKETEPGFKGQRYYKSLLGKIPKIVSSVSPQSTRSASISQAIESFNCVNPLNHQMQYGVSNEKCLIKHDATPTGISSVLKSSPAISIRQDLSMNSKDSKGTGANLQAHLISYVSGNGAKNIYLEKTSKHLSGGSCFAPSLKQLKDDNMLPREGIGVAVQTGPCYTKPKYFTHVKIDDDAVSKKVFYNLNSKFLHNEQQRYEGDKWIPKKTCAERISIANFRMTLVRWIALSSSFTIFEFNFQKVEKNGQFFLCVASLWAKHIIGLVTEYYISNVYSPALNVNDCQSSYPFERGKKKLIGGLKALIVASDKSNMQVKGSGLDVFRVSVSSAPITFNHDSAIDDCDALCEAYKWGKVINGNTVKVGADMNMMKTYDKTAMQESTNLSADLIADWYARTESKDLSVIKCMEEAVILYIKCGLQNLLARSMPMPPTPLVLPPSIMEGNETLIRDVVLHYPFVIWRASSCINILLQVPYDFNVKQGDVVAYQPYGMVRLKFIWGDGAHKYKPVRWITKVGLIPSQSAFKFAVFLLQIQWIVSVTKPFQVH